MLLGDGDVVSGETKRGLLGSRIVYLELIRCIAIFFVIFNHTGTTGFLLFSITENAAAYPFYLFLSILSKIAVPLFFMVSGALLITKDEGTRRLYGKRIARMACVIVVFSLIQYVYKLQGSGDSFSIKSFLSSLYSEPHVVFAYWFLYSYLAILVLLPFLRRMARGMTNKEYLYLALIQVAWVGVWPIVRYLLDLNAPDLSLPLVSLNIFFFLMGYFTEHRVPDRCYSRKNACIAVCVSVVLIGVSGFMTWLKARQTGDLSPAGVQTFHNGLIAIPTFSAYFLTKLVCKRFSLPAWMQKAILWLGGTAFGIYLVENIARSELKSIYTSLFPHLGSLVACLVWVVVSLIASALVVSVLKLIPLVKKAL